MNLTPEQLNELAGNLERRAQAFPLSAQRPELEEAAHQLRRMAQVEAQCADMRRLIEKQARHQDGEATMSKMPDWFPEALANAQTADRLALSMDEAAWLRTRIKSGKGPHHYRVIWLYFKSQWNLRKRRRTRAANTNGRAKVTKEEQRCA